MKLVPRFVAISAVAVLLMIGIFVLLTFSETPERPGPIILAAVLGVSLPSGFLLGFLGARRIWSRCMPAGTYRTKPAYWLMLILILVTSLGSTVARLVSMQVVFSAAFGEFGVLATVVFGMGLFERRTGCHLAIIRDPSFWPRWVEYRVEPAHG